MDFLHSAQLLDWMRQHTHLAELATFLFAFSESIAVIGLIVPGSLILASIGTLIGVDILPLWPTLAAAVSGAILGDTFSFVLGYAFSDKIPYVWPFRKYPKGLQRGRDFFARHGGKSVFIGRFAGPIRPITPLIAGMMQMRPVYFLMATTLSGLGWAPVYMLPGVLLGRVSTAPHSHLSILLLKALLLIFLPLVAIWLCNKVRVYFYRSYCYFLQPLSRKLEAYYPKQFYDLTQSVLLFTGLFSLIGFLLLWSNLESHSLITVFNAPLYHFFRGLRTPIGDQIMLVFTSFGNKYIILAAVAIITGYLCYRKQWPLLFLWLGISVVTLISAQSIKYYIYSPRPLGNFITRAHYSFPSGHLVLASVFLGFVAILYLRSKPRLRRIGLNLLLTILFLLAVSRLYLNAHWLTDIIGAYLLSATILAWGSFLLRLTPQTENVGPATLRLTVMTFFVGWFFFFGHYFHVQQINYHPFWPIKIMRANSWWQQGSAPVAYQNHFGRKIGQFNIQWNAEFSSIKQVLTDNGWHEFHHQRLRNWLRHFTAQPHDDLLPLTSPMYQDQPPVAEWALTKNHKLYLLRLWNSHIILQRANRGMRLWYGSMMIYKGGTYANIRPSIGRLPACMQQRYNARTNHLYLRGNRC